MNKTNPFLDPAKALAYCEVCLDEIQRENLHPLAYEFFFNSFIFSINQFWELTVKAFENSKCTSTSGLALIRRVNAMRADDQLLLYVREARNQLAHRESVLWISDDEIETQDGLGAVVSLGANYYTTDMKRYSCLVLPSLSLNFVGTTVAAKPVFNKQQIKIAVPKKNSGQSIGNTPLDIMNAAYDFYGQKFGELIQFTELA